MGICSVTVTAQKTFPLLQKVLLDITGPDERFYWCQLLLVWGTEIWGDFLEIFLFIAFLGPFIWPWGLRDLSSPIRDWTWALTVKAPSPNHWTNQGTPSWSLYNEHLPNIVLHISCLKAFSSLERCTFCSLVPCRCITMGKPPYVWSLGFNSDFLPRDRAPKELH